MFDRCYLFKECIGYFRNGPLFRLTYRLPFVASRRYSATLGAVDWVGYVNTVSEPTGNDKRYLSVKVMIVCYDSILW
jgi:hypothetical protein